MTRKQVHISDKSPAPVTVGTHLKFPTMALRFFVNWLMICIPYEVQARNVHTLFKNICVVRHVIDRHELVSIIKVVHDGHEMQAW